VGLLNDSTGTAHGFVMNISVPGPSLMSITPSSGPAGTTIILAGAHLEASQTPSSQVTFDTTQAQIVAWSDTEITLAAPSIAEGLYKVMVKTEDGQSNTLTFTITPGTQAQSASFTSVPSDSNAGGGGGCAMTPGRGGVHDDLVGVI